MSGVISQIQYESIIKRLENLESMVKELQQLVIRSDGNVVPGKSDIAANSGVFSPQRELSSNIGVSITTKPKVPPPPPPIYKDKTDINWNSEFLLNKIGIGLFLLGIVFLFKFSIDKGWITPAIRVVFGLVLGTGLFLTGFRTYGNRRHFSLVLLGGAIATYYICGFSAFNLYALISYPTAFGFMVSVTVFAFIISLKQNEDILSLIGVIGGLGTPFLLYTGTASIPGLVGYTCLIISGMSAIYFYKGWSKLLITSVVGGWVVLLIVLEKGLDSGLPHNIDDHWALQSGVIFAWLLFWLVPLIREVLIDNNLAKWLHGLPDSKVASETQLNEKLPGLHVYMLTVSTAVITLAISMQIWSLSDETWGGICIIAAVIYALVSAALKLKTTLQNLAYTNGLVGVLFLTFAFSLLLEGDTLLFAVAAEGAVLQLIAYRLGERSIVIVANIFFIISGLMLGERLLSGHSGELPVLNSQALTELWVIGLALGVSRLFHKYPDELKIYRLAAHVAILAWLSRELSIFPSGQAYVTIAWGIYAAALLIVGLRMNIHQIRTVAVGTLLLVVVKLFLVDLVKLKAIWRILLFIGFGGLFLVLSYYFRALWKQPEEVE